MGLHDVAVAAFWCDVDALSAVCPRRSTTQPTTWRSSPLSPRSRPANVRLRSPFTAADRAPRPERARPPVLVWVQARCPSFDECARSPLLDEKLRHRRLPRTWRTCHYEQGAHGGSLVGNAHRMSLGWAESCPSGIASARDGVSAEGRSSPLGPIYAELVSLGIAEGDPASLPMEFRSTQSDEALHLGLDVVRT